MQSLIERFSADETGATAIEYGIIASFIALAIITVLQNIGIQLSSIFVDVEAGLKKRPAA